MADIEIKDIREIKKILNSRSEIACMPSDYNLKCTLEYILEKYNYKKKIDNGEIKSLENLSPTELNKKLTKCIKGVQKVQNIIYRTDEEIKDIQPLSLFFLPVHLEISKLIKDLENGKVSVKKVVCLKYPNVI